MRKTLSPILAILLFGLFFQACTTEKIVEKENDVDVAALRDSIYSSLKDSILEDFEDTEYDSILEDSIFDRLYADFYGKEMDRIETKYDSLLASRVNEILSTQDSLLQAKDSAAVEQIDSLREALYDSLYGEVYDELYSASAISNIQVATYGFYPTIHPAAYPFQDSIYEGALSAKLAYVIVRNLSSNNPYYLVLKAKVPGTTLEGSISVPLNPGQKDTLWVHPALNWQHFTELAEIENTQIEITVSARNSDKESVIWSATESIKVEPMNMVPPMYTLPGGGLPNVMPLLAQWVQDSGDSVAQVIFDAANLHTSGSLVGYQNPNHVLDSASLIRAQVKAIYQALQARGIHYISGKISPVGQRVNLPEQTLRGKTANCLDGTILFAAALEAIGIHPVMILIPGHSFIGWKVWDDLNTLDFVETTMTWGTATFTEANTMGSQEFDDHTVANDLEIIDVVKLQKGGLSAFPIELKF